VAINNSTTGYNPSITIAEGMLEGVAYDYVSLGIVTDTETYTFKTGGAGGTTVAVIVIVYTDATRADISTVTRTT
jgi:hypothetical protein